MRIFLVVLIAALWSSYLLYNFLVKAEDRIMEKVRISSEAKMNTHLDNLNYQLKIIGAQINGYCENLVAQKVEDFINKNKEVK